MKKPTTERHEWSAEDRRRHHEQSRKLLGGEIRTARLRLRLTQAQLGRAIGKSVATVSKIEDGVQACEVALFSRIAQILSLDASKVLLGVPEATATTDYHRALVNIFRRVVKVGPNASASARRKVTKRRRAA